MLKSNELAACPFPGGQGRAVRCSPLTQGLTALCTHFECDAFSRPMNASCRMHSGRHQGTAEGTKPQQKPSRHSRRHTGTAEGTQAQQKPSRHSRRHSGTAEGAQAQPKALRHSRRHSGTAEGTQAQQKPADVPLAQLRQNDV
eukprot:1156608-Pelagomonas_calceolata.AAC.3